MVLSHSCILMMINGDICEYFDDGGDGVEGYMRLMMRSSAFCMMVTMILEEGDDVEDHGDDEVGVDDDGIGENEDVKDD